MDLNREQNVKLSDIHSAYFAFSSHWEEKILHWSRKTTKSLGQMAILDFNIKLELYLYPEALQWT